MSFITSSTIYITKFSTYDWLSNPCEKRLFLVHLWTYFRKFFNKNQWNALFSNICTHTIVHSEIKQGWHFSHSFVVSPWFTEKQFSSVQPSTRWKQIVNNRSFCGWTTKSWISIEQNVHHFWRQFQVHQECTNI